MDFFEQDIPRLVTSGFGLIGSLAMLVVYDSQIAIYCVLLLLPIALLQNSFTKRYAIANYKLNNQLEEEVKILTLGNSLSVKNHYQLLAKYRIRLSNLTAMNWGAMEILIIGFFLMILFRAATLPNLLIGDIYPIISYAWNYRQALDVVPISVQQLERLKDIGTRMVISDFS